MKIFTVLILVLITVLSFSQNDTIVSPVSGILEEMSGDNNDTIGIDLSLLNKIATYNELFSDSVLVQKTSDALIAYCEYQIKGLDHRARTFEWQYISTRVIFFIVLLLVVVGIVFSGIQFRKGMKEGKSEVTTAEVSPTGIKFSSSVLGVIILFISLMFFYLYLIYVYPISEIF